MRISIFNQTNHNTNIFDNNVKQVTLKVVKTESKEKLAKLVTDRSARNRIKSVTDYGNGHWYYVNYKDEGTQTKHAVIFMNETRSIAFANYREGKGFVEYKCSVVASTSGTAVWNLYPENNLNELAMTNSMASTELTLEEALKEIARLKEENLELVAQRDAAINEAKEARAVKARHYKRAQTQKNIRQSIEMAAGQKSLEERFEELDLMVENGVEEVENKEEVKEIEIAPVAETVEVEVETKVELNVVDRGAHALDKIHNPIKWAMVQNRINSGELKVA